MFGRGSRAVRIAMRVTISGFLLLSSLLVSVVAAEEQRPVGCVDVEYPPEEDSLYVLPYEVGDRHNIRQGNCNELNTHNERFKSRFAYDFEMPIGTTIVATRDGRVIFTRDNFTDDQHELNEANLLVILHDDGSYARYGHLTFEGALVDEDERVVAGQAIALSGNSGLSRGPHLHFDVVTCPEDKPRFDPSCRTTPVSFRNTSPHPHGLIGSPTSEIGGGEWYEAFEWEEPTDAEGEAASAREPYWTLEELGEGIFAALQPADVRFNDANVTVMINDSSVVVVDAPADRDAIDELIDEIDRRTSKPVRYVINTHWHGDHTQGNARYRQRWPEVRFIGHSSLTRDIVERAAADHQAKVARYTEQVPLAESQLEKGLSIGGTEMTAEQMERQQQAIVDGKRWLAQNRDLPWLTPNLAFDERLILDDDGRRIELHHFAAHTDGDTVVYLPEEGIVLTGDMLDDMPFAGHGHPTKWIAALATVERWEFETIVPGHGPLFRGKEQLLLVKGLFEALVGQVRVGVAAGRSLEELRVEVDLTAWREALGRDDAGRRFFDQTMGDAIERAFEELQSP